MSIVTPTQKKLYEDEGYMILPGVIPPDMLSMLREECSYFLGYYDSMLDAKGVQSEGITHRGKRYFINNRYRLSSRLTRYGNSQVTPVSVNGQQLFRVRIGPVASVQEADSILEWITDVAPQARIVAD